MKAITNTVMLTFCMTIVTSYNALHALPLVRGRQDSVRVDRDGNKYTFKRMEDGFLWMTTNLNLNVPESYCYENINTNCKQYGRLYTWESAQKVCVLLGDGWRLPTITEWRDMIKYYGGMPDDSSSARKKAYKELLTGGSSGFNALLGGGRESGGKFARINAHGFYWTATENTDGSVWFTNFGKGSQSLYRQKEGEKLEAHSVRCIKK